MPNVAPFIKLLLVAVLFLASTWAYSSTTFTLLGKDLRHLSSFDSDTKDETLAFDLLSDEGKHVNLVCKRNLGIEPSAKIITKIENIRFESSLMGVIDHDAIAIYQCFGDRGSAATLTITKTTPSNTVISGLVMVDSHIYYSALPNKRDNGNAIFHQIDIVEDEFSCSAGINETINSLHSHLQTTSNNSVKEAIEQYLETISNNNAPTNNRAITPNNLSRTDINRNGINPVYSASFDLIVNYEAYRMINPDLFDHDPNNPQPIQNSDENMRTGQERVAQYIAHYLAMLNMFAFQDLHLILNIQNLYIDLNSRFSESDQDTLFWEAFDYETDRSRDRAFTTVLFGHDLAGDKTGYSKNNSLCYESLGILLAKARTGIPVTAISELSQSRSDHFANIELLSEPDRETVRAINLHRNLCLERNNAESCDSLSEIYSDHVESSILQVKTFLHELGHVIGGSDHTADYAPPITCCLSDQGAPTRITALSLAEKLNVVDIQAVKQCLMNNREAYNEFTTWDGELASLNDNISALKYAETGTVMSSCTYRSLQYHPHIRENIYIPSLDDHVDGLIYDCIGRVNYESPVFDALEITRIGFEENERGIIEGVTFNIEARLQEQQPFEIRNNFYFQWTTYDRLNREVARSVDVRSGRPSSSKLITVPVNERYRLSVKVTDGAGASVTRELELVGESPIEYVGLRDPEDVQLASSGSPISINESTHFIIRFNEYYFYNIFSDIIDITLRIGPTDIPLIVRKSRLNGPYVEVTRDLGIEGVFEVSALVESGGLTVFKQADHRVITTYPPKILEWSIENTSRPQGSYYEGDRIIARVSFTDRSQEDDHQISLFLNQEWEMEILSQVESVTTALLVLDLIPENVRPSNWVPFFRVRDSSGNMDSVDFGQITIHREEDIPDEADSPHQIVGFTYSNPDEVGDANAEAYVGEQLEFYVAIDEHNEAQTLNLVLDFGDQDSRAMRVTPEHIINPNIQWRRTIRIPKVYNSPGRYTATLTVRDENGVATARETLDVNIGSDSLLIHDLAIPSTSALAAPAEISFSITSRATVDWIEVFIDYGDGTPRTRALLRPSKSSIDLNFIHRYKTQGSYGIEIFVQDSTGNITSNDEHTIEVRSQFIPPPNFDVF